MANSVVPMANPPMARARMARPRWRRDFLATTGWDVVIDIDLLLGASCELGRMEENPITSLVRRRGRALLM
ncbi:hypothetical protein NtRootA4_13280 [Arthrobacter sp. NtRootA4]|nr:hypothetical protein NtRootA2_15510 [Arthrobacter sp. NtRootA2]BCW14349.1 hypothetical protein NtRootA4_13280 [Arthrobacter sp. NtRootA4]GGV30251.1 hypothetical protein GCM10010212_16090 [Paenarthrobacter nicotinovorans]